jgi:hypothetical protein
MADTIGSLVDKLATVNQKLFLQQELIYEIRRMSFEQFLQRFVIDMLGTRELYDGLHKISDLNLQRNALMGEVDQRIVSLIKRAVAGEEIDDGASVQRAHKTQELDKP